MQHKTSDTDVLIDSMNKQILDGERRLTLMQEQMTLMQGYVEKILHISSVHWDTYAARSARPYYALKGDWGLTSLSSGEFFYVHTADRNVAPWIIMGGTWEPNVDRPLLSYATPGMTVLDIGAHFGYYTVKIGKKIGPTGSLFAFEPNPEVNVICLENMKINSLFGWTHMLPIALGDQNCVARLTHSDSNMASANLLGDQDADYSVDVSVRRLDDVLAPTCSVDLIKLDAEGYEKRILDGAVETLARSPQCAIMIELGLERWERGATLDELVPACGGGKTIFAVCPDGTLKLTRPEDVRPLLLQCAYHENYFLIGPDALVREKVGHLIVEG